MFAAHSSQYLVSRFRSRSGKNLTIPNLHWSQTLEMSKPRVSFSFIQPLSRAAFQAALERENITSALAGDVFGLTSLAKPIHLRLHGVGDHFKRLFWSLAVCNDRFLRFLQLVPVKRSDRNRRPRFRDRQQAKEKLVFRCEQILALEEPFERRQRSCFFCQERLTFLAGNEAQKTIGGFYIFCSLRNDYRPSA